jgi:hypothetical protein
MNTINNNINFTSNFAKSARIIKDNKEIPAVILELEKSDVKEVQRVVDKWDTGLSDLISRNFYYNSFPKDKRIFSLSTQTTNFRKLDSSKAEALFELTDEGDRYLFNYLDVNPKHKYNQITKSKRKGLKQIGRACIDFVKSKFGDKDIEFYSLEEAKGFYEHLGIKQAPDSEGHKFLIPKSR